MAIDTYDAHLFKTKFEGTFISKFSKHQPITSKFNTTPDPNDYVNAFSNVYLRNPFSARPELQMHSSVSILN